MAVASGSAQILGGMFNHPASAPPDENAELIKKLMAVYNQQSEAAHTNMGLQSSQMPSQMPAATGHPTGQPPMRMVPFSMVPPGLNIAMTRTALPQPVMNRFPGMMGITAPANPNPPRSKSQRKQSAQSQMYRPQYPKSAGGY